MSDPSRLPARRWRAEHARDAPQPAHRRVDPPPDEPADATAPQVEVLPSDAQASPWDGGRMRIVITSVVVGLLAAGVVFARSPEPAPQGSPSATGTGAPDAGAESQAGAGGPEPAPAAPPLQDRFGAMIGPRSCLVALDGDRTLVSINGSLPLTPASAQKVLVARAAIEELGVNFQFKTRVMAREAPGGGIVDDLWLVGGGDPTIATPEYMAHLATDPRWGELAPTPLDSLAESLSSGGLRHVGVIHGDASRYTDQPYLPSWPQGYIADGDISAVVGLTVNGGFVDWGKRRNQASDPALHAASELRRLLAARGVLVREASSSPVPPGAVVVTEMRSQALAHILAGVLRASDNLGAELIVRELGLQKAQTGTTAAGLGVVETSLTRARVPMGGVVLRDGSGLDRANLATCAALAAAVDHEVAPRLSVAGQSGTLKSRFVGTPLQGVLKAKTGWIAGVVSMAGQLDAGRPIRFAIVQNGVATLQAGQAAEERVLLALHEAVTAEPAA